MAFTIVDLSLMQLIGEYLLGQKVREEERLTDDIAARVATTYAGHDAEALYGLARALAAENDGRVLVTDMWGVVQSDSDDRLNGTSLALREIADVLSQGGSSYGYYNVESGGGWFALSLGNSSVTGVHVSAIQSGREQIGALAFVSNAQELYGSLSHIQRQIFTWLVLVAIAVLLASLFLSRAFTKPIGELNQGILRMTKGDLHTRVRVKGNNEFAQLGRAFNQMSAQLEQLNTTRNAFVSDASHELKTPLSTVKILVQTLLYQDPMDPDMARELLGDIDREVDRMNLLVSDLLSLVRINSGAMKLNLAEVPMADLVGDTVRRLRPMAEGRQISLRCDLWDEVTVVGDSTKLQQVVYNLVDNAVKYTPAGGAVRVELSRSGKKAVVTVTDNGIGIPQKDVPHVFERFYRVDKARSRETGGTGLGLAIVKEMVQLHDGSITFTSEENVGTVFTLELPISGPQEKGGAAQ